MVFLFALVACSRSPTESELPIAGKESPVAAQGNVRSGGSASKAIPETTRYPDDSEEARVRRLYRSAYEVLGNKRDNELRVVRVYRQCLKLYSHTKYLNTRLPPHNKTRIEIIEDVLRTLEQ